MASDADGLVRTAVGPHAWIPYVSAAPVRFLSLGSTALSLGARGVGRQHETRAVLAFLLLAAGGVVIGVLVVGFLLQAYDASRARAALSVLREGASLLIWGTLPATFAVTTGFGFQVAALAPPRLRGPLLGLCLLLAAAAGIATVLSVPELDALRPTVRVTAGTVADFLLRLSLYRMLEAPAYVGLALLFVQAHSDIGARGLPTRPAVAAASPEKG